MTFAFGRAAATYSELAADTDTLSGELSAVLGRFEGMSGLPIDAHMDRIQHSIDRTSSLALSMQETAQVCSRQDGYDAALAAAPTPAEVAAAKNRAVWLYTMYHQGSVPLGEAVAAQREADALQAARDQAVEQHAQCTAGTLFDVPSDGGWQPDGSGEGGPGGDDPWGEDEGSGSDDEDEDETPASPPPPDTGIRRLPLMEPGPVPVIPSVPITPEPEAAIGGTDLSSSATPSALSSVQPTGTYTPAAHIPTVQNQPTAASPSWMQPTAPVTTQQAAQRPYAASPQSKQREQSREEERAAEKWLAGDTGAAVAAVSTTHSVTSAPSTPTSAPSAPTPTPTPTPTATPTTPAAAPAASAPTSPAPAGAGPVGGGMAPGMAGAGHGQGKTAAAPKIPSADPTLQQMFDDALKQRPYEEPVRDGLLGPIINPRQAEAGR